MSRSFNRLPPKSSPVRDKLDYNAALVKRRYTVEQHSAGAIARDLGISLRSVMLWLKANRVPIRKAPLRRRQLDAHADLIRRKYLEEGVGICALAEDLGTSVKTLSVWLADNGIAKRSHGDAVDLRRRAYAVLVEQATPEILRQRAAGASVAEIASSVNLMYRAVSAVLTELGDPLPRSDAGQPKASRGRRKLNEMRDQVLAAVADGMSGIAISRRFKVSHRCVLRWIQDNEIRLCPLNPMQKTIVGLWQNSDMNMNAISRQVGCSRHTVSCVLRKAGLVEATGRMGRPPGSAGGRRPDAVAVALSVT